MATGTLFADISHYQDADLATYKAAGFDRICMKVSGGATDGTLRFSDAVDMPGRWRQAGELGLCRIGYHFARNNNSGADEFDWFISLINAAGGLNPGDVLCYDQEDNRTAATTAQARQRTLEWMGRAVALGYTTGWVYSGKWYLEPANITAAMLPAGWRQLWMSDYTAGQPDNQIEVPAGWVRAQIVARQFTDAANVPGIPGTDADRVLHEWITGEDITMADAASLETQVGTLTDKVDAMYRLLSVGDAPDNQTNPDGSQVDRGGHPWNLERVSKLVTAATAAANAAAGKVDALAAVVAAIPAGGSVDPAAVAAALDLDKLAAAIAAHIQLKAV